MWLRLSKKLGLTYLGDHRTIDVLNFHASVVASKHKRITQAFYDGFREFIRCLRELNYNENYEDGSPLRRAYLSFMVCKADNFTSEGRSGWYWG